MKLIVTGATGLIGGQVLQHALRHPDVTAVVALTRRQLPAGLAVNERLTTVLVDDFETYPEDVMKKLEGAAGCVWTLGTPSPGGDLAAFRKINVEYLQAALDAFGGTLAPALPSGAKFRFVYTSGIAAQRDPEKAGKLWIMSAGRGIRGDSETITLAAPESHPQLETFAFRPGAVLRANRAFVHTLVGSTYSVLVDDLAAALLDSAIRGGGEPVVECPEIARKGKAAREALATREEGKAGK